MGQIIIRMTKSKGKQEKEGEAATELTATVSGMYTNASPTGTNANSPVCQTNTAAGKDSISLYNVSVSNNIANNQSSPNVSGNRGQFNFVNVVLTHVAAIEGNILMIGSGSITGTSGDFTRTGVIIIVTPFGASVLGGFTVNADGTITIFLGAGGCLFQKSTVSMSLSEFQRIITDDGIVFQGVNQTGAFLVRTNDVFTVDQQSTRTRLALHVDRVENGVATFSYQIFEY
ncbi:MAG: hypothetical protein HZC17_01940 [Candidatus Omnitrophica bacterium]|nr:hypothetical protein [Candidatus Omnitrophota bacterium]